MPDNTIYVIDLTASPPAQIATIEVGKQASTMAINRAGGQLRGGFGHGAGNHGKSVKVVGTRSKLSPLNRAPCRPRRCALPLRSRLTVNMCSSSKGGPNRTGWLDIDGQTASFAQVDGKNYDMPTGLNPLNVQVAADGKLAIVNNIGGVQDGQVDTVGMIDLEAGAPRVIDKVVSGDGPEGLAMSPAGGYVTSPILNGTAPKTDLLPAREIVRGASPDRGKDRAQCRAGRGGRPRLGHRLQPGRALSLSGEFRRRR